VGHDWSKRVIELDNGCWTLPLTPNKHGYLDITLNGKSHKAHRFFYELYNEQKIPKGMLICHKCDNRRCVNPSHLFIGTSKDNFEDAVLKGRIKKLEGSKKLVLCKKGHVRTDKNTYYNEKSKKRFCRDCKKEWDVLNRGPL